MAQMILDPEKKHHATLKLGARMAPRLISLVEYKKALAPCCLFLSFTSLCPMMHINSKEDLNVLGKLKVK